MRGGGEEGTWVVSMCVCVHRRGMRRRGRGEDSHQCCFPLSFPVICSYLFVPSLTTPVVVSIAGVEPPVRRAGAGRRRERGGRGGAGHGMLCPSHDKLTYHVSCDC